MPHLDNRKWISQVLGREFTPGKPMSSLAEIPARRDFWQVDPFLRGELPRVAACHEDVVLRERQGVRLKGEVYVPQGQGPFPVALYLHGGWFCLWSAKHVRKIAMRLAAAGHVVLNLDYGLAPEHPFPWAVEDAVYALRWLRRNAEPYGGDATRLAVSGDSCGATLSAAAIIALTSGSGLVDPGDLDGIEVALSAALLFYGVFDYPLLASEPGSNVGIVEVAGNLAYLGPNFLARYHDPLVSPVYASHLDRFPPCYLSCGDEDSLLGQTLSMTRALTQANVPTTLSVLAGADHAFPLAQDAVPGAHAEMDRAMAWLAAHSAAPARAGSG